MTVIENINIAYVSQDLSLLSSADADGTKDLRYLSVFAIGCMILLYSLRITVTARHLFTYERGTQYLINFTSLNLTWS